MRYVACNQDGCDNRGMPYTVEDGDEREHDCPACGKPMDKLAGTPTATNVILNGDEQ